MLKKTPVDWLLSRLTRSRNARRKCLSFKHDRQGAAPHVPSAIQELEDRVLLAAEIAILGNGVEIVDGDTTPSALDGTIYPDTPVGGISSRTFTIQNTGDTDLMVTGFGSSGPPFVGLSVQDGISHPTVAANGGTFTFTFFAIPLSTVGDFTETLSVFSDDATYNFDVMITVVANTAPTLSATAAVSAAEGATGVISTVTATDPDAPTFQTLTYSISGGADLAAFSIDSSTGALSFADPSLIDFENPTDTGGTPGDNIYEVIVAASDGTDTVMQTVNVTVTDVSIGTRTVTLPDGGGSYRVSQSGGNIVVGDASFNRLSDDQPNDFTTLVIQGSSGDDIVTLSGNLTAFGHTFRLIFNGAAGNDSLDASERTAAGAFAGTFNGGSGNDTLIGGGGADVFIGGTGNDSATGGAGNDSLTGNSGNDTLSGDAGDDFINGNANADFLTGGDDNDTILGGAGTDTLDGGAGNDFVNGQGGEADVVAGGGGTDTLKGGANDITIAGAAGIDPVDPAATVPGVLNVVLPDSGGPFTVLISTTQLQVTSASSTIADVLLAEVASISITGSAGDDAVILDASLAAFTGTVSFAGGAGDDLLDASAVSINTIFAGGAGNDTLIGGGGGDNFAGGDGDDSATGGAGNDTLNGGNGNDSFSGDDGDDFLNGNAGDDSLFGGNGSDTILGGRGVDLLDGGDGSDVVNGQGGLGDTVAGGGGGADTLRGDSSDTLLAGPSGSTPGDSGSGGGGLSGTTLTVALPSAGGTFTVLVSGGQIQVTPSGGGDALIDEVFAGINSIILNGGTGDDAVVLDATLSGFAGQLTFNGGAGNDSLNSSAVSIGVVFNGGDGDDTVTGGSGNDTVNGGAGNDSLSTGAGSDSVNAGSGNDFVDAGADADTVFGQDGDDSLIGGTGDDFLNGNAGNDTIAGGDDNDTLLGGAGMDSLDGGLGNDIVRGQGGDPDTVIGGGGVDTVSS
tara:strand:- start:26496 stop:29384 length:2889 start_codon:yes stop_codon:yes gene_type:complete